MANVPGSRHEGGPRRVLACSMRRIRIEVLEMATYARLEARLDLKQKRPARLLLCRAILGDCP